LGTGTEGLNVNGSQSLDVLISLVNTNSRDLLRQCLLSLPDACRGLSSRTTLVDNASTDGSAEMVEAEFPDVELIRNTTRRGFSANHNQSIRLALDRGARFVLVLNEDTVLEPGSVRALVECCDARKEVGAAGPLINGSDGSPQRSLLAFPTIASEVSTSLRPGRDREPRGAGWLNGSCVLFRTDALRQVGTLDERFFIFFEDTDIGLRLHDAGWESVVCPTSRILHYGHQVVSQPAYGDRMVRQMIRSRDLYFRKHRGPARASIANALCKSAFRLRAMKAGLTATILREAEERQLAGFLWGLASYDPREALPHELDASSESHTSSPIEPSKSDSRLISGEAS
jgi:GT2 family glycosyltransferase